MLREEDQEVADLAQVLDLALELPLDLEALAHHHEALAVDHLQEVVNHQRVFHTPEVLHHQLAGQFLIEVRRLTFLNIQQPVRRNCIHIPQELQKPHTV